MRASITRRFFLLACVSSTCALVAFAPSTTLGANAGLMLSECGNPNYGGSIAPLVWDTGCVGSSPKFSFPAWTGWGEPTATASGTVSMRVCEPNCAGGYSVEYPVTMTLSAPKWCSSTKTADAEYYTGASWTVVMPAGNPFGLPAGPDVRTLTLLCDEVAAPKPRPLKTLISTTLGGSATGGSLVSRPSAIYSGGTGSDTGLRKLKWKTWRKQSASGRGKYLVRARPGAPNANKRLSWPVQVKLSRVRECDGSEVFTRIKIRFTDGVPNGFSSTKLTLKVSC